MELTSDEVSKYGIEEEEEAGAWKRKRRSNWVCRRLEATNGRTDEATWLAVLRTAGLDEEGAGEQGAAPPVEIWRRKRLERESSCVIV